MHQSREGPELEGQSISCETDDFSRHGLQFLTNKALIPETQIDVLIEIGDQTSSYLIRGEILWTTIRDNQCFIGVNFSAAEGTDLDAWIEQFESLFESD